NKGRKIKGKGKNKGVGSLLLTAKPLRASVRRFQSESRMDHEDTPHIRISPAFMHFVREFHRIEFLKRRLAVL
ncbi:MAG TPA: hypothetical protein VN966_00005, partial [Candidatus Bathyarchaeia archaeon]|nr:hypothetical protein [Candidatus Bathyarchaeia archaeon]